jgi:glycosyltransferase involved in cell wall biosynthesis
MSLSIVTCVFNGESFVDSYWHGIQNLGELVSEVIIVNDGSIDRTESLLSEITDERVKVINKVNTGLPDSRNIGLEATTKEFVIFLDVDDTLNLDVLTHNINLMAENKTYVLLSNARYVDKNGDSSKFIFQNFLRKFALPRLNKISENIFYNNFLVTPSTLILRKDYLNTIKFDSQLTIGEDWEFFTRVLATEKKLKTNMSQVNYYVAEVSMSSTAIKNHNKLELLIEKLNENYNYSTYSHKEYKNFISVILSLFELKRQSFNKQFFELMCFYFDCISTSTDSIKFVAVSFFKYLVHMAHKLLGGK